MMSLSPHCNLPSCSAAPPLITFVMKIPVSPATCSLPTPPAMLNPRPAFKHVHRDDTDTAVSQPLYRSPCVSQQVSYDKKSMHPELNNTYNIKSTHTKTKARFSRLIQHPAWKRSGSIPVEWEEMKKQENKRSE